MDRLKEISDKIYRGESLTAAEAIALSEESAATGDRRTMNSLRPLLERCLEAVKAVPLFEDLEADLRAELGKKG